MWPCTGEVEQALDGVDLNSEKGWDQLTKKIGVRLMHEHLRTCSSVDTLRMRSSPCDTFRWQHRLAPLGSEETQLGAIHVFPSR